VRRRPRLVRLAATAGLIVAAAIAATIGARILTPQETPAPTATLERIARKNDAAAMRAAAAMEARARAQTNVVAPTPDG
jgi:hypothetical protein